MRLAGSVVPWARAEVLFCCRVRVAMAKRCRKLLEKAAERRWDALAVLTHCSLFQRQWVSQMGLWLQGEARKEG